MTGEMSDRETGDFWSASAEAIALEFGIPKPTAASWERNIGDVEVLQETLGRYGPENYLELIRRREWIPRERKKRKEEWVEPLQRWCTKKVDGVYLVHKSEREDFRGDYGATGLQSTGLGSGWRAIALINELTERKEGDEVSGINWTEEMVTLREKVAQKKDRITYEMRRVDPEWIELTRELRAINKRLKKIYRCHLEDADSEFQYKKDEIIELKRAFPYLRANANLVAETTNSSVSHVNEFKHIPGEGVTNRQIKAKLRNEVLNRDGKSCVSCDRKSDLQVHHIVPRNQGGKNTKDNLATLCTDCHYYAHGGGQLIEDNRYTGATWDSVEYDDHAEFWDKWIHQDFEERAHPF
jgi:5-methylcytosine-specific restriction endonuclease McrA